MTRSAVIGESVATPGLVANSRWNLIAFGLTLAAHFITIPFVIAWIGLSAFGQAGLVLAIWAPLMVIGAVLAQATTRHIAERLAINDRAAAGRILSTSLVVCVITCLFSGAVLVLVGPLLLTSVLNVARPLDLLHLDFAIAGIGWIAQQLIQVLQAASVARRDFRAIAYITALTATGTVGSTLAATALWPALEGYLAGVSLAFVFAAFVWVVGSRLTGWGHWLVPKLHWNEFHLLLHFGKWQAIAHLAGNVGNQMDRYVLGALASPSVIGQFNAANRVQEAAQIGVIKATEVLFPYFGATARLQIEEQGRFFLAASWTTMTFSALVLAPAVPLADSILRLWAGPDVADGGGQLLRILVIAGAIGCGSNVFAYYLMGIGQNAPLATISVLYSIITSVSSFLFIFMLGPYAAGSGIVVASIVRVAISIRLLKRRFFTFLMYEDLVVSTALPLSIGLAVGMSIHLVGLAEKDSWLALATAYFFIAAAVLAAILGVTCLTSSGRKIIRQTRQTLQPPVEGSGVYYEAVAAGSPGGELSGVTTYDLRDRPRHGVPFHPLQTMFTAGPHAHVVAEPSVTIVDYGVGNIAALLNMLDFLGVEAKATDDPSKILRAKRLLLPGVGSFDKAMSTLKARELIAPLNEAVLTRRVPVLGVCLGMQLLARRSEEGQECGLGWIAADVLRIRVPLAGELKVPHIGWSYARGTRRSRLFPDTAHQERFYFVHSYYVACYDPADIAAVIDYGSELCCAVESQNIYGVQFHPEKSHRFGMSLLSRFAQC